VLCALASTVCRRSPIRRRCGSGLERGCGGCLALTAWLGKASMQEPTTTRESSLVRPATAFSIRPRLPGGGRAVSKVKKSKRGSRILAQSAVVAEHHRGVPCCATKREGSAPAYLSTRKCNKGHKDKTDDAARGRLIRPSIDSVGAGGSVPELPVLLASDRQLPRAAQENPSDTTAGLLDCWTAVAPALLLVRG
jgi:hypothetical protein